MLKQKTIIIFFSSLKEANSLLYQSELIFNKEADNIFISFTKNYKIIVFISGIGKISIKNINSIIKHDDLNDLFIIIKAGTCAVLDPKINLGKIVIPEFVGYNEKQLSIVYTNLPSVTKNIVKNNIIKKGLITLDEPLQDKNRSISLLKNDYALADMETYFFLEKYKDIPFIPILVGTDRGDKTAKNDFIKMLPKASLVLKEIILKIILI